MSCERQENGPRSEVMLLISDGFCRILRYVVIILVIDIYLNLNVQ